MWLCRGSTTERMHPFGPSHAAAFRRSNCRKNTGGSSSAVTIISGILGIPPEVREKIFNPFFTTKPAGEGTGLGLSMSHDIIVKQHGGSINVETERGVFTEFIIILPRGDTASDSKPK